MSNEYGESDSVLVQGKLPCEDCGSSDGLHLYSDGHGFCFAGCHDEGTAYKPPKDGQRTTSAPSENKTAEGLMDFRRDQGRFQALSTRRISEDTCKKYGYWIGNYKGNAVQVANIRDKTTGELLSQKVRFPNKEFLSLKAKQSQLFGAHLWSGGKKIVITEGEIDCLTVAELYQCKYPVVSLPLGAGSAKAACAHNYEYLDGFDEIILMFDMDDAGRAATIAAAEVLPQGKVKVALLPLKDANECLLAGKGGDVINAVWNAQVYVPDGVVSAFDLLERVMATKDVECISLFGCDGLRDKTLNARQGEVVMVVSGSGSGKSTYVRENTYNWFHNLGIPVGVAMLEEAVEETVLDILGIHIGQRIRQTNMGMLQSPEFIEAYTELFKESPLHLYDSFAEAAADRLLSKLEYMSKALGCKVVVLDHISIVVSGMQTDNERKAIDNLMTRLKSFAKANGVLVVVVSHLSNPESGTPHEEGRVIKVTDLRGSAALRQLSDTIIALERDQQGDNPNLVLIRLLKCRFTGEGGVCGYMEYDPATGRLIELNDLVPPPSEQQQQGEQHNDFADYSESDEYEDLTTPERSDF